MEIPLNQSLFPEFTNFCRIGSGAFSTVYSAVHISSNLPVAIKKIDKFCIMTEIARKALNREIQLLSKIDHPFCIQFFQQYEDLNSFYILTELCSGGSLLAYLQKIKIMKEHEARSVFCQLLSSILYLHHTLNIAHRDIKLENILLDHYNNLRLIDFGFACYSDRPLTEKCGSFPYSAPEILENKLYDAKVDIWSLGVTLFALVTGAFPFQDEHSVVVDQPQFPQSSRLSPTLKDLLIQMLQKDPAQRPSAQQLAVHSWVLASRFSYYLSNSFLQNPKYHMNQSTNNSNAKISGPSSLNVPHQKFIESNHVNNQNLESPPKLSSLKEDSGILSKSIALISIQKDSLADSNNDNKQIEDKEIVGPFGLPKKEKKAESSFLILRSNDGVQPGDEDVFSGKMEGIIEKISQKSKITELLASPEEIRYSYQKFNTGTISKLTVPKPMKKGLEVPLPPLSITPQPRKMPIYRHPVYSIPLHIPTKKKISNWKK